MKGYDLLCMNNDGVISRCDIVMYDSRERYIYNAQAVRFEKI